MTPIAFVDDDAAKRSWRLLGVPVRGTAAEIAAILSRHEIEEVVISSPAIDAGAEAAVRTACAASQVPVRRLFLEIK